MNPPNEPTGTGLGAAWLRALRRFCISERLLPGVGYRKKSGVGGYTLEIPAVSKSPWFHPFRIYPVGDQKYQVRGGYVGFRSTSGQLNSPSVTNNKPISDNGETVLQVRDGADGVYQDGTSHDFWSRSTTPSPLLTVEDLTLSNSTDVSVATTLHAATYTLDSDLDGAGQQFASFWVEITDDGSPNAVIKARMWAMNVGGTGRPTAAFPLMYGSGDGSNNTTIIIPIGVIVPRNGSLALSDSNPLEVEQFHVDHVINRYAPGVPNADAVGGTCGPCFWRGEFTEDSLSAGVYFYDGDLVSYDTVDDASNPIRQLWIHKGSGVETGLNANFRLVAGNA